MRKEWMIALVLVAAAGFGSCAGQESAERYKSPSGLEFVLVKAGTFQMGSNDPALDAKPPHTVTLTRDYYIATTEITFDAYDVFTKEVGGRKTSDFRSGRGTRPAVDLTWLDAVRFCNWLSGKDGLRPAYKVQGDQVIWVRDADGYRLPTEAEWEYAAHGGPLGETFRYAGSDNPDDVSWFSDNSSDISHPVESKKPNGLGLFDMSGNVSEYCWDWSKQYDPTGKSEIDSVGPRTGTIKAVRGGSHITPSLTLPVSRRAASFLNNRTGEIGFRVARSMKPSN